MIMMMMLSLVQSLVELYNYIEHVILLQHGRARLPTTTTTTTTTCKAQRVSK